MSNDSQSNDTRVAAEFVEHTRNRLERSYKNNVIVTIVVLSLVTLYFTALNHYVVDEAISTATVYTDTYKDDVAKYTQLSKDSINIANALTNPDIAPGLTLRVLAEQTDATLTEGNISWDAWVASLKQNLRKIPEWAADKDTKDAAAHMKAKVESWTEKVVKGSSTEIGEAIDAYIEDNQEMISKFAENAEDEDARNIVADGLQARLVSFMDETEITNRGSLAEESKNVLIKLQRASDILKELAERERGDLNQEQRQLRLAIALMMEGAGELKLPGDGSE